LSCSTYEKAKLTRVNLDVWPWQQDKRVGPHLNALKPNLKPIERVYIKIKGLGEE